MTLEEILEHLRSDVDKYHVKRLKLPRDQVDFLANLMWYKEQIARELDDVELEWQLFYQECKEKTYARKEGYADSKKPEYKMLKRLYERIGEHQMSTSLILKHKD